VASVRIRFLSDLRRDYYIQVSDVPYINHEKSPLSLYENVSKEREIFLRASLQLLDLKENRLRDRSTPARHLGNPPKQMKPGEEENKMHDVIRLGFLKKCSHPNGLSMGGNSRWKTKYVELRHGLFTYSDCGSNRSLKDLAQSETSSSVNKRAIELIADVVDCFSLSDDPSNHSSFENISSIFVLLVKNGSKRLWMAANGDECKEWVRNIKSAILGTNLIQNQQQRRQQSLLNLPRKRADSDGETGTNDDGGSEIILVESRQSFTSSTSLSTWLSIEGAAAPYARNMSLYLELKTSFNQASSELQFKQTLRNMHKENFNITIPVLFVKSKSSENHFVLSAQDSLTSHNFIGKECSSQIWKDLQRDRIVIDGDEVTGDLGAEAMVGALVRHITEKAEIIKTMEEATNKNSKDPSAVFSNPTQNFPYHHHHNPFFSRFSVNDAQIVECARDLLVLCNRTQSGGDTYFCVDALFRGEASKDLCLLAPYSPEAEPLNFNVDIVEIHREHVPSIHRKSYHPKDSGASFRGHNQNRFVSTALNSSLETYIENQQSPGTSFESKVRFDFQETPTVALYEQKRPLFVPDVDNSYANVSTRDENRRRPQLNLTEILEQDGYLLGLRRPSEPLYYDFSDSIEPRDSTRPLDSEEMDKRRGGSITFHEKSDVPSHLLVSSSKDDQSIVSELTFDTFFKHANRDHHSRLMEVTNLNVAHDSTNITSGEEDTHLSDEKEKGLGLQQHQTKNKSLLNKIGKRLKLPKLSDLDGLNSPFSRRRPSLKSESSGDEKHQRPVAKEILETPSLSRSTNYTQKSHAPIEIKEDNRRGKTMCIRVQVQANSKFKLCTLNPSGIEEEDNWATISGTFYQSFYIVGDGSGHLGIADRLVTVHVDSITRAAHLHLTANDL